MLEVLAIPFTFCLRVMEIILVNLSAETFKRYTVKRVGLYKCFPYCSVTLRARYVVGSVCDLNFELEMLGRPSSI